MRFVARFVVLVVVLSVLIDLTAQIAFCFQPTQFHLFICVPLRVALLIGLLNESSLAGLLWHYLPAIVVSLLIAIAWTLKLSTKGLMNMAPLPRLRHPALRFAVLLFVLSVLYDLSYLLSSCFSPLLPFGSETFSDCFRYSVDEFYTVIPRYGLLGILWHYVPVVVVATIDMTIRALKDCPERRQ